MITRFLGLRMVLVTEMIYREIDYSFFWFLLKVICRVRPLNKNELSKGEKEAVTVNGNQVSVISKSDKKYNFDAVIGPNSTQQHVFDTAAKHVLDDVLQVGLTLIKLFKIKVEIIFFPEERTQRTSY